MVIGIGFCLHIQNTISQCSPASCLTDQIDFSTAIDPITGLPLASSSGSNTVQDPLWILTGAPTNNGPVNLGSPAFVIDTYSAWDDMPPISSPPSKYISAFPTSGSNEATPAATPYVFERKICVCGSSTTVSFQDLTHVDNQLSLSLLGPGLGSGLNLSNYNSTVVSNFRNPPEDDGTVNNVTLQANSTYILHAEMINDNTGSPMGFNINGQIIADQAVLSVGSCCNNGAFISGYKFLDENCDGIQDSGEPTDAGWVIVLKDNFGTPIQTATTDISGYYFFNVTTPGLYTVEEQSPLPAGFNQTYPASPSNHTVNITGSEIVSNLNFGNCCPDCQLFQGTAGSIGFTYNSSGTQVTITPSGLTALESYAVDINCNGIYEINNIPGNTPITHTFPHTGLFDLKIKVSALKCGKPCGLEFGTTRIKLTPEECQETICYEWEKLGPFCNVHDLAEFNGDILACGDLVFGFPGIGKWNGSNFVSFENFALSQNVFEIEPFQGNLFALAHNPDFVLYKWNGISWSIERSSPHNSFHTDNTNHDWFHDEMIATQLGLFVAFHKDNFVMNKSSHEIHYYSGSAWSILPDPINPTIGPLFQYFMVGEYDDFPIIRADYVSASGPVSQLLYWDSSPPWKPLTTDPIDYLPTTPGSNFGEGITVVKQKDDNTFICGGSFTEIKNGPQGTIPGTRHIAELKIFPAPQQWSSIGGGSTTGTPAHNRPGILDMDIIGDNIFVVGAINEMGGTPVERSAWYDGSTWNALYDDSQNAFFNSTLPSISQDGECEIFIAGECQFGKTSYCCLYEDLKLTGTETGQKLYHTHGKIETCNTTISPTANVVYKAGQGANHLPVWTLQSPGQMTSLIEGCGDCCPDDPLNDLPFLAAYIGNPNFSITQYTYNGDCIYQITDYCIISDGSTSYFDCLGNLICVQFQVGGTCPIPFTITNPVVLQSC